MTKSDSEPVSKQDNNHNKTIDSSSSSSNSSSYFSSADEFCKEGQGRRQRISTSSKHLDLILGGGLEVGQITQFYGGPGSGKTHLCHTLCAAAAAHYQVIYIDTENGFREDKMKLIAGERGVDWKHLSQNIHLARPKNCSEQEDCIEEASHFLFKSVFSILL